MRYTFVKPSNMKSAERGNYNEEIFRREFEKAMKDGHIYGVSMKKGKRFRSAFTTEQVNYLEKEFRKYPYIGNARRKDVANVLNIPERAVKIWFQNRRMKEKKDTTNKESDGDKAIEFRDQVNIDKALDSNCSLPLLPVAIPSPMSTNNEVTKANENKHKKDANANIANFYRDISPEPNHCDVLKINLSPLQVNKSSVIKNNHTVQLSMGTHTMEFPTEEMKNLEKNINDGTIDKKPLTNSQSPQNLIRQAPHMYKTEHVRSSYASYMTPSAIPQDLSSKSNQQKASNVRQNMQEMKFGTSDVPLYLKGFYQPYIPPGNMIWKPINVAPLIPSPIPAVAIPSVSLSGRQQNVKRSCNCDCHLKRQAPVYYQDNNANPNVQYVITAVPFHNTTPKF